MIGPGQAAEIFALYQKHGWVLRRVLLSADARSALASLITSLPADVAVIDSEIDAAWFSRPPASGGVAWEIRYLGEPAFALVENIDADSPDFESALRSVKSRLSDAVAIKKSP